MDSSQSQEMDLDRTDRLPILEGVDFDPDVEDDAVKMDFAGGGATSAHVGGSGSGSGAAEAVGASGVHPVSGVAPGASISVTQHAPAAPSLPPHSVSSVLTAAGEFSRLSGLDLPSLAESVRSVEERISRQNAEYEALTRSYERVLDSESMAVSRANALALDLSSVRAMLEGEQTRTRTMEAAIAERNASVDGARARAEEALRESERYQAEARTLRESLSARDSAIAQVLHSLGERDAQLSALQREHAKIVPILEARSKTGDQLEQELRAMRETLDSTTADLKSSREATALIAAQLKRGDGELLATRSELYGARAQANGHLELLRTRDYRRGFDLNLFRELDAERGAATASQSVLIAERDDLKRLVANLSAKIAEEQSTIAGLRDAASSDAAHLNSQAQRLTDVEKVHADFSQTIAGLHADIARLNGSVQERDQALLDAQAAGTGELLKAKEALLAAEKARAELAERLLQSQQLAETREEEMSVLVAHLNEARRPLAPIEADVRRLTEELAASVQAREALEEDNRALRGALDKTRGQLEEREFLIRRLERSESNNANVLGRIQTSIERLGTTPTAAPITEMVAELLRLDNKQVVTYPLGRRTRVGRAPGCELQIDASSVSRHHALILVGVRDVIIEDLNSTNGVLVNGRRVTRQLLTDGDAIVIGEVPFRLSWRPANKQRDGHVYESMPRPASAAPAHAPVPTAIAYSGSAVPAGGSATGVTGSGASGNGIATGGAEAAGPAAPGEAAAAAPAPIP